MFCTRANKRALGLARTREVGLERGEALVVKENGDETKVSSSSSMTSWELRMLEASEKDEMLEKEDKE